jgi:hypothetical protein
MQRDGPVRIRIRQNGAERELELSPGVIVP